MFPPGDVFRQTDQVSVAALRLDDAARNNCLAQGLERFESSLAAQQLVPFAVVVFAPVGHGDWPFEADGGNILDQLRKYFPIPASRVKNTDTGCVD
jgi:hypothetical protein